jgi:tetratricopeptide (TPR) repeat protein
LLPVTLEEGRPSALHDLKRNNFYTVEENVPLKHDIRSEQYARQLQFVAEQTKELLQRMRKDRGEHVETVKGPFAGKTVLLAEKEDDVEDQWDDIHAYLSDFGVTVLSAGGDRQGDDPEAFGAAVRSHLEKADLFVQLLSPVDEANHRAEGKPSCAKLQYDVANSRPPPLGILQWRKPRLRRDALKHWDKELLDSPHVLAVGLEEFKRGIKDKLNAPPPRLPEIRTSTKPYIYITADEEDIPYAQVIKQKAEGEKLAGNCEIIASEDREKNFEEAIRITDVIVVLFGAGKRQFVDDWLRFYARKKASGGAKPPELDALCRNAVRRPTSFGELVKLCNGDGDGVRAVVEAFRAPECNFLLPEVDAEPTLNDLTMVDIAHESLIRQWRTLSRWLEKEGHAAHEWHRLKDDAERGPFIYWQQLGKAIELRDEVKPTAAWAERYGGGFDKITRMITRSQWLQRAFYLAAAVAVVLGLWACFTIIQKTALANSNFELAVTSSQTLLDTLGGSVNRGDITLTGANAMLEVAKQIATQVSGVKQTKQTVSLLVELAFTTSDIYYTLGDNTQALDSAKRAEELIKPLRAAAPNDPEVLRLLYGSIWRAGDAISMRGRDEATQRQALARFLEAEKLALRLMELAPDNSNYKRDLLFVQRKIGDVDQMGTNTEAAIAEYKKALPVIEAALAKSPTDPLLVT